MAEPHAAKLLYEVLGVGPDATVAEVKLAYRQRVLEAHPDKRGGVALAGEVIPQLQQAYATLVDPAARQRYDERWAKELQKRGHTQSGAGLDVYSLADFVEHEGACGWVYTRPCPRCTAEGGFEVLESQLEEFGTDSGSGGWEVLLQCSSCSLWLKVEYWEGE